MNESQEGRDIPTDILRYRNDRIAAVLQEEITRGDGQSERPSSSFPSVPQVRLSLLRWLFRSLIETM